MFLTDDERAAAAAFKAENELFTVDQVALVLGVSRRTIMNYLKRGQLAGVKIGGKWKFTAETVRRFMAGEEQ